MNRWPELYIYAVYDCIIVISLLKVLYKHRTHTVLADHIDMNYICLYGLYLWQNCSNTWSYTAARTSPNATQMQVLLLIVLSF